MDKQHLQQGADLDFLLIFFLCDGSVLRLSKALGMAGLLKWFPPKCATSELGVGADT